jgi:hypothetical protein
MIHSFWGLALRVSINFPLMLFSEKVLKYSYFICLHGWHFKDHFNECVELNVDVDVLSSSFLTWRVAENYRLL